MEEILQELAALKERVLVLEGRLAPKERVVRPSVAERAAGVLPKLSADQCCPVHGRVQINRWQQCPKCFSAFARAQSEAARAQRQAA